MKVGFILSCYNRVDDLMAHLDIFKYCPFPHEIIITYLKHDIGQEYLDEINKYPNMKVDGVKFSLGPLISFIEGIRGAGDLGIDYVCYRNADDWLFNWDFEKHNFEQMEKGYLCAGYNWFSVGTYNEFAMNQFYAHVPTFLPGLDIAKKVFLGSANHVLCEHKMPKWLLKAIGSWDKLYRLPDREQLPGIGHDLGALTYIYQRILRQEVPQSILDANAVNNRFFNEKWQLIGSHNNTQRLGYWRRIREQVPYFEELEKEKHFSRWLHYAREGLTWNLPNSEDHIECRKPAPRAKVTRKPLLKRL